MAMDRACYLLNKYADAKISDKITIFDESKKDDKLIKISIDEINGLLGLNIPKEEIIGIFERLGFIVKNNKDKLEVTVPSRRIDISIKEDLIEEVARIYGIDKIEGVLPVLDTKKGSLNKFTRGIREKMVELGLNETMSYTLIPKDEVHKYTNDSFDEINLLDPMSDDHRSLRYSLLPSMMMTYDYNSKRNNKDLCVFEIQLSISDIPLMMTQKQMYYGSIPLNKVDYYEIMIKLLHGKSVICNNFYFVYNYFNIYY